MEEKQENKQKLTERGTTVDTHDTNTIAAPSENSTKKRKGRPPKSKKETVTSSASPEEVTPLPTPAEVIENNDNELDSTITKDKDKVDQTEKSGGEYTPKEKPSKKKNKAAKKENSEAKVAPKGENIKGENIKGKDITEEGDDDYIDPRLLKNDHAELNYGNIESNSGENTGIEDDLDLLLKELDEEHEEDKAEMEKEEIEEEIREEEKRGKDETEAENKEGEESSEIKTKNDTAPFVDDKISETPNKKVKKGSKVKAVKEDKKKKEDNKKIVVNPPDSSEKKVKTEHIDNNPSSGKDPSSDEEITTSSSNKKKTDKKGQKKVISKEEKIATEDSSPSDSSPSDSSPSDSSTSTPPPKKADVEKIKNIEAPNESKNETPISGTILREDNEAEEPKKISKITNIIIIILLLGISVAGGFILFKKETAQTVPEKPIFKNEVKKKVTLPSAEGETYEAKVSLLDIIPSQLQPKKRYLVCSHPNNSGEYMVVETTSDGVLKLLDQKAIAPGTNLKIVIKPLSEKTLTAYADERKPISERLKTKDFFGMDSLEIDWPTKPL
jgi:hypothetical protein